MSLASRHRSTERKNREIRVRNAQTERISSYRTLAASVAIGIIASVCALDVLRHWVMNAIVFGTLLAIVLMVVFFQRKQIRIPVEGEFPLTEPFDEVVEEIRRGWNDHTLNIRDDPGDGPAGRILVGELRIILSNDHGRITILRSTFADGPRTLFGLTLGADTQPLSVSMPGHPDIPPSEWSAEEREGLETLRDMVLEDIVGLRDARKRMAAAV